MKGVLSYSPHIKYSMAGLGYWVTGSNVYRNLRDTRISLDDVLSPLRSSIYFFYASCFNHIYRSAILIMFKSTVLSYNYDKEDGKTQRVIAHDGLPRDRRAILCSNQ